jgi:hypothetical protein
MKKREISDSDTNEIQSGKIESKVFSEKWLAYLATVISYDHRIFTLLVSRVHCFNTFIVILYIYLN